MSNETTLFSIIEKYFFLLVLHLNKEQNNIWMENLSLGSVSINITSENVAFCPICLDNLSISSLYVLTTCRHSYIFLIYYNILTIDVAILV